MQRSRTRLGCRRGLVRRPATQWGSRTQQAGVGTSASKTCTRFCRAKPRAQQLCQRRVPVTPLKPCMPLMLRGKEPVSSACTTPMSWQESPPTWQCLPLRQPLLVEEGPPSNSGASATGRGSSNEKASAKGNPRPASPCDDAQTAHGRWKRPRCRCRRL